MEIFQFLGFLNFYFLAIGTNFDIKDQSDLAAKLNIDPETRFGMWISFYEIYNDNIFDLLYAPTKNKDEKRVPLKIREEMKNRIPYVEGNFWNLGV